MLVPHSAGDYLTLPRKMLILIGVGICVLLVGAFLLGRTMIDVEAKSAIETVQQLQQEAADLRAQNAKLLKQQAFVESAQQVDQASVLESQHALAELQEELNRVNGQLAFYQRIVSPETERKGLYVESLSLSQGAEDGEYKYQLTLAQSVKKQPFVKGKVEIRLSSGSPEAPQSLSVELSGDEMVFGFRYFQVLQGSFQVAKDAQPERIEIVLTPTTKNRDGASREWLWSELLDLSSAQTN